MAKPQFTSVDQYLADQPDRSRPLLAAVRAAIRHAIPQAEETIAYNIPAYKLDGATVIYFAGWSKHFSIYPAKAQLLERFKSELEPYAINKSTIQIPLREPIPIDLIARIAKYRVDELAEERAAKDSGASR